ncbi:MAG: tRNA (adenosine(37)-N6)-threonylcarbamoyltransferase complex transferase subunit TsaD [Planctomycetales bacterium]|nr:tRNA (adenosine(37)-N6)-threonylcarbamoyltransferase complex transferase subunit TsaD [Planctomycetales bacterium]
MTLILSIESTCDETAAAVIDDQLQILSSVVASQEDFHARFGGVVPEIASRAHVERILPVIDEALRKAGVTLDSLDAIAVAHRPGLAGSLLIGVMAAKALAWSRGLPLIGVDHLQAHIYACRLAAGKDVFPCVGMIVSGGHSHLYECATPLDFRLLGGTIDDAAGEAFDKIASLLGLGFPGGPAVERAAAQGDPQRYALPRPLLNDRTRLQFSFSGLKTAVRYGLFGAGATSIDSADLAAKDVADMAASAQQAIIDCLVGKAELAMEQSGYRTLCVGGGVAANGAFRRRLEQVASDRQCELYIPPLSLCTDNAAMGALAVESFQAGKFADLELDIEAGLRR